MFKNLYHNVLNYAFIALHSKPILVGGTDVIHYNAFKQNSERGQTWCQLSNLSQLSNFKPSWHKERENKFSIYH